MDMIFWSSHLRFWTRQVPTPEYTTEERDLHIFKSKFTFHHKGLLDYDTDHTATYIWLSYLLQLDLKVVSSPAYLGILT